MTRAWSDRLSPRVRVAAASRLDERIHSPSLLGEAPGQTTRKLVRAVREVVHSFAYSPPAPPVPLLHNKVPVCLAPAPAETLRQMLLRHGIVSIHWWNPTLQGYQSDEPPFMAALGLETGSVFSMLVPPSTPVHGSLELPYQLTGRVPAFSELVTGPYEGSNAVTWPVTAAPTTASALLDDPDGLPYASAVGWWDPGNRHVLWYPDLPPTDLPGVAETVSGDFEIASCSALYVYIDAGYADGTKLEDVLGLTWPPALADAPAP